jgi:hypothetical protein
LVGTWGHAAQCYILLQKPMPSVILAFPFFLINFRAHLGATISGIFFGYLTCPSVEFDNSAKNGQKEAVALIRQQAHPCKSAAVFFITILAFAVLAFAYGTQFNNMDLE